MSSPTPPVAPHAAIQVFLLDSSYISGTRIVSDGLLASLSFGLPEQSVGRILVRAVLGARSTHSRHVCVESLRPRSRRTVRHTILCANNSNAYGPCPDWPSFACSRGRLSVVRSCGSPKRPASHSRGDEHYTCTGVMEVATQASLATRRRTGYGFDITIVRM